MSMNFKGALNLAHINVRRESAGEDAGPVAVDIKLTAEIGIKAVAQLFYRGLAHLEHDDGGEIVVIELEKFE